MIYDFIEIGTSDFETIIQSVDEHVGLSIDAVGIYLDRLPDKKNVKKLNYGISNYTGEVDVFYVDPADIEKHNLPWFLKGCNSIGEPHVVTLRELKNRNLEELLKVDKVPVYTWKDLVAKHEIEKVKILKIDAEGHDIVIVKNILESDHNVYPESIIFEANELTSEKDRTDTINLALKNGYEFVEYNAKKDVILKYKKNPKILLINSWMGKIPDYYEFHERTMQFQNENIDMYLFTDQDLKKESLSKNYHICKISEDNVKYRFFLKTEKYYNETIIGRPLTFKLLYLNNFFNDIIDYSKYDYVGIYDTDTLFGDIYDWVHPYLLKKDFISIGGGVNHNRLSGPFCIFRNNEKVLKLFESEDYLNNILNDNFNYLEHEIDRYAKSIDSFEIIQHSQNVDHETSRIIFEAEWSGGKVFCNNKEILVHHFYRKSETKLNLIGSTIKSNFKKTLLEDFYWVTSFDKKYEHQVLSLIKTIEKFSNRKCILFAINYNPELRYNLSEQFILRTIEIPEGKIDSKGRNYNFLVCKPMIDIECIKIKPHSKFVHIDTDVLLTITCDDIINNLNKLDNYPLFNSHTHDEFIIPDGNGGHANPIRILAEKTGDPIRVYPRRKTNIYLFDKNSEWFFKEQMNIFEKYYETAPHILHFHDEDTANIILNRHDYRNSLHLVDMEESEIIDMNKFHNYSYGRNPLSDSLVLPKTNDDILMFHGNKEKDKQERIIKNYVDTVFLYDDIVTYIKDDAIWFEKNSNLSDKKIEDTLNFYIHKDGNLIGELTDQKIHNYWYFFIGGINFTSGNYTCTIREKNSNRLIFKKLFKI